MRSNNKSIFRLAVLIIALMFLAVPALLLYFGIIHINHPESQGFKVKGVDVSSYQGDIDWNRLASEDISFAYIKATEGSSTVDRCFENNWQNASQTGLRIGAYHFFSFESSGRTQAELFCNTVKPADNMLPPVIDVEYYGSFRSANDIDVNQIRTELRAMVDQLTDHFGMKPVIYVSKETYNTIVKGYFDDCGLWYRSVYSSVPDDANWTFWQYSNRHRLNGYTGKEKYIDMNVFYGSPEDIRTYP